MLTACATTSVAMFTAPADELIETADSASISSNPALISTEAVPPVAVDRKITLSCASTTRRAPPTASAFVAEIVSVLLATALAESVKFMVSVPSIETVVPSTVIPAALTSNVAAVFPTVTVPVVAVPTLIACPTTGSSPKLRVPAVELMDTAPSAVTSKFATPAPEFVAEMVIVVVPALAPVISMLFPSHMIC